MSQRDLPPGSSMRDLIDRTKMGRPLDRDAIRFLVRGVADGSVPDYQVAAWLMAARLNGLSGEETLALTREMVATGGTLDWSYLGRPVVDKHSTGGVGDKTSLALVPLVAAAGASFVKMSGRGLGHTGGTVDKLESIPGFRVELESEALRRQVERIGCALIGQSRALVPADGALYALRDVTGTVDSVELIASSIMAKKLAAGAEAIVLDVKYGEGALLPDPGDARRLARAMLGIGRGAGRRVRTVLSDMGRPLGRTVGNALEVREALDLLRGEGPADLWELVRELGAHLLTLAEIEPGLEAARGLLTRLRDSGEGVRRMEALVEAQGGDARVVTEPERLPLAPSVEAVLAPHDGRVQRVSPRGIADVTLALGGARRVKGEAIDPAVGVVLRVAPGDVVRKGDPIADVHARSAREARSAAPRVAAAILLGAEDSEVAVAPQLVVVED